jgi:hypothetical protein
MTAQYFVTVSENWTAAQRFGLLFLWKKSRSAQSAAPVDLFLQSIALVSILHTPPLLSDVSTTPSIARVVALLKACGSCDWGRTVYVAIDEIQEKPRARQRLSASSGGDLNDCRDFHFLRRDASGSSPLAKGRQGWPMCTVLSLSSSPTMSSHHLRTADAKSST